MQEQSICEDRIQLRAQGCYETRRERNVILVSEKQEEEMGGWAVEQCLSRYDAFVFKMYVIKAERKF